MIISAQKPPIYERIQAAFGDVWEFGAIMTYGDTVFTKKGSMSLDLYDHEQTHIDQQTAFPGGKDAWWDRYIVDPKFRLDQEVEAYRNQVKYVREHVANRKKASAIIDHCAQTMVQMYGGMVANYQEAYDLIT